MKKAISLLTAMAIAAPIIPAVFADDEPTTSTPEVTVVGKRIIDGDPYFEISLEVNGDYEDYSGVSVVLEYDPQYIVPAESWDEGATQADMSENDSWATRRALPTLGKDTWTSHTALAYEAKDEVSGKKTGYLYLGAEYPGQIPSTAAPGATAAPAASDPDATAEPSAEPNDDPYTNPVVVARFMYAAPTTYGDSTKIAEDVSDERASTKEALEDMWQYGAHPTPAAEADRVNWDTDWSKNTILTIAPDAIAFESPAQFPFAYYDANFDERAFMFDFPTPVPTIDAAATAVPTGMPVPTPVHNQYPSGSRIAEDNQLKAADINIVLGLGKSAKATGGLSLSDIYVVMFFDWNDSLIGTLTAGVGAEGMNKTVSNYVKAKMVHPELQDDTHYDSNERKYTYRGEYPFSGADATLKNKPGGTDSIAENIKDGSGKTVKNPQAGSNYPITNKLDYYFAGKTFYEDAPYAGGWTLVTTENMTDTRTWFDKQEIIDKAYNRVDEHGVPLDDSGTPDASLNQPDCISCNFDTYQLPAGESTVMVKAVYLAGPLLDIGGVEFTPDETSVDYSMVSDLSSETSRVYTIDFNLKRVNPTGNGVTRPNKPQVKQMLNFGDSSTVLKITVDNEDVMPVSLIVSNDVETTGYQLRDADGYTVMTGAVRTTEYNDAHILSDFELEARYKRFIYECYSYNAGKSNFSAHWKDTADCGFYLTYATKTNTGTKLKQDKQVPTLQNRIQWFMKAAAKEKNPQTDPYSFTWYQLQYGILTATKEANAKYISPEDAKKYFGSAPGATYPGIDKPNFPFIDEDGYIAAYRPE